MLATPATGSDLVRAVATCAQRRSAHGTQEWIFLLFAAAFLVKMPAFPLHGWMPDGYRAMPIEVLVRVLRRALEGRRLRLPADRAAAVPATRRAHFQDADAADRARLDPLRVGAWRSRTTNARLVAGYSSVAQLGFITLGIFSLDPQGAQGALLQMVNHGLVVAPLFLIVGLLARRAGGSEDLRDMGGIAFRAPVLAALFLIVALATLAMPGSANFVGEFLILLGIFKAKLVIALRRVHAASCSPRSTCCGFHPHDAQPGRAATCSSRELSAARRGRARAAGRGDRRSSRVYPQLALHRSEKHGDAVEPRSAGAAVAARRRRRHGVPR